MMTLTSLGVVATRSHVPPYRPIPSQPRITTGSGPTRSATGGSLASATSSARIGDSPFAPKFHVVAMPNDWTKSVATATKGSRRAAHYDDYLAFWQGFAAHVASHVPQLPPPKPAARNWIDVGPTMRGVRVTVAYSAREKQSRLYVLVRTKDEPQRYEFLEKRADLISRQTGQELTWHPQADRGGGFFGWGGPEDREVAEDSEAHYAWLAQRLVPIIEVLKELLEEYESL